MKPAFNIDQAGDRTLDQSLAVKSASYHLITQLPSLYFKVVNVICCRMDRWIDIFTSSVLDKCVAEEMEHFTSEVRDKTCSQYNLD